MAPELMCTPEEVAFLLKVTPETIRRACRDGRIAATRIGRVWRIPISEVARIQIEGL